MAEQAGSDMGIRELFGRAGDLVERENEELKNEVHELREDLDRVIQDFDGFRQVVSEVLANPEMSGVSRQQTGLERLLAQHEERIGRLSKEMTRQRADLVSADHLQHQEITSRLRTFIQQDMYAAVSGVKGTDYDRALALHYLSRFLFDRLWEEVASADIQLELRRFHVPVQADEFERLRAVADELKKRAADTRHGHDWMLDCAAGVPVDQEFQLLWDGAPADGPVTMLVAPGYRVGDKVYSKQYVFTDRVPAEIAGAYVDDAGRTRKRTAKVTAAVRARTDGDYPAQPVAD